MNVSRIMALFMLVFRPRRLIDLADAELRHTGSEEAIQRKREDESFASQTERHVRQIRQSLCKSLVLVLVAFVLAYVCGHLYLALERKPSDAAAPALQEVGTAILLWATLGRLGWSIQTMNGDTLPERVNEWVYRAL